MAARAAGGVSCEKIARVLRSKFTNRLVGLLLGCDVCLSSDIFLSFRKEIESTMEKLKNIERNLTLKERDLHQVIFQVIT